jgi:hypothetical protein
MYLRRDFTRFTLPSTPYPRWTPLLPLSMIRTMARSTSQTPSRRHPCHPSLRRRMSIHRGCVHTRATSLRYLNQSIVLCAPQSSHGRPTSTDTFGLVRFFSESTHVRNLTYDQIRMNDFIAVMYVILRRRIVFVLTIGFRRVSPSLPAATSSRGTNEAAVICGCLL